MNFCCARDDLTTKARKDTKVSNRMNFRTLCSLCSSWLIHPGILNMKVVVNGVTKEFVTAQGTTRAIGGVNLEVRDREFFGIIGPTGCGKTTLLHIIAGLEKRRAPVRCSLSARSGASRRCRWCFKSRR